MQAGPLQLVALASILLFSLVGTGIGGRLLLLARRTRETPELALGLCLVAIATFGYPLSIVSLAFQDAGGGVRALLLALTAGTVDVGIVAVLVFNGKVFRPASRLARSAAWGGGVALLAILLCNVVLVLGSADQLDANARTRPFNVAFFAISTAAFAWSALESAGWHRRLRRRLALGLAEPVVVDRFRLWTVWGLSTMLGAFINLVYTAAGATIHHPVPLLITSLCGFVNAASLVLAFFPPRGYLERAARAAD